MYSITVFNPPRWWDEGQRFTYDNKTHRRLDLATWADFRRFFYALADIPKMSKKDAHLISPAIYREPQLVDGVLEKVTRSNKNVSAWAGWAAVDVDAGPVHADLQAHLAGKLGKWNYLVYSTASSSATQPKYRIVFDLNRHVQADEIRAFWFAIQSLVDNTGDKQCKDLSRMYYTPANYLDANNFIFHNEGDPIDVDKLLIEHPHIEVKSSSNFLDNLTPEWQQAVMGHRMAAATNTDIRWNSYLDCPFVSQRALDKWNQIAHTDGTGRYRMVYKMMVGIAISAIKKGYPISAGELVALMLEIDANTSNKYQNRPLDVEANNALTFAYRNTPVPMLTA